MLGTRRGWGLRIGVIATAVILANGSVWPKGARPKDGAPALWIAADRVVGFVPFTVTLYGKVAGTLDPGGIELCRDAATTADLGGPRGTEADPMDARADRHNLFPPPVEPACSAGNLVPGKNGFDYSQEVRFDRPGAYRVRLSTMDATGHRVISNTVQVNAF